MNKISIATGAASIALLLASAAPALAHDGADDSQVKVNVGTSERIGNIFQSIGIRANASGTARVKMEDKRASSTEKRIEHASEKAGDAIDQRIESLQKLISRLEGMKLLPADTLVSIKATLNAQISDLEALKAKIGVDTSADELKSDIKSITQGNRVYLLSEPKARIAAASARIKAVVAQMQTLGTKLQERINAAATAGVDVTAATAAMTDFNTQLSEATANANAAISLTANLQVDNGDKTIQAANTQALTDAKAKLVAAQKDLAEARQDVAKIVVVVKGKGEVKTDSH